MRGGPKAAAGVVLQYYSPLRETNDAKFVAVEGPNLAPLWVQLHTTLVSGEPSGAVACHVALTDISERHRLDQEHGNRECWAAPLGALLPLRAPLATACRSLPTRHTPP